MNERPARRALKAMNFYCSFLRFYVLPRLYNLDPLNLQLRFQPIGETGLSRVPTFSTNLGWYFCQNRAQKLIFDPLQALDTLG